MPSFLKNHPFAVEAFFDSSVVFTFAVPKKRIEHLIPECLALDCLENRWGFIAVAMVQTKHLRPKGFPQFMGNDFFLIGYRIFVRYSTSTGKSLRGLYILKSETDKYKMQLFGNIFTHYNYSTTDIQQVKQYGITRITSKKSDFSVEYDDGNYDNLVLPEDSPFDNWKGARRFAGPLPFTFTYNYADKTVLIIEGVRTNWNPMPLKVVSHNFSFLDKLGIGEVKLANAFIIRNIPYTWKKGRIEKWKH